MAEFSVNLGNAINDALSALDFKRVDRSKWVRKGPTERFITVEIKDQHLLTINFNDEIVGSMIPRTLIIAMRESYQSLMEMREALNDHFPEIQG